MASYISPKVEVKPSAIAGEGVFAKEKIFKAEVVFDFSGGTGKLINTLEMNELLRKGSDYGIQIDDDLFFAATSESELESGDYLNHSCEPNLGIQGSLQMVARRDIEPGEELAFDYAMSESSDYKIDCRCGAPHCRQTIAGEDWKIKELQEKYRGYFSDYLAKKIASGIIE
ncbi:MAG: SET domain-containing protein-lysine N-methyltransferase [Minisyncoccia bacterium]